MNLRRMLKRSYHYFNQGYTILAKPFALMGYASSIYYLAIKNIHFLRTVFPNFSDFLLIGVTGIIPTGIVLGYLYMKSPFYRGAIEVGNIRNPYNYRLPPGRASELQKYNVLAAKKSLEIWRKLGVSDPESEQQWMEYIEKLSHLEQGGDIREV